MKTFLKVAAALVVLLVGAILALPFLIDANRFRPLLEQQISQALNRKVTIGNLSLAILQGGVSATELSISEDPAFGTQPFLGAKSLNVGVDLSALIFSRALHVQAVTIDGADVALIQDEKGDWNFSSLGSAKAEPAPTPATPAPAPTSSETPLDLSVKLVRIQNARVSLTQNKQKRDFTNVNFELRDFSTTAALPFSLSAAVGGGTVSLTGTAGPISKTNTAETPFDTQIEIKALDLTTANFTREESGLSGVLTFTGNVNSNGTTAAVKGATTIDRLRLSRPGGIATRPVAANIALVHNLKTRSGNIARSTIKLGSASAEISGSYNLTTLSPTVNVALAGPNMPLPELLAFLPVFDIVLPSGATIEGGTITIGIASRGTLEHLNSTGSIKIEKTKLANYDLGSKLKIVQQFAGLPTTASTAIDLVAAAFDLGPFGTRVKNIQFVVPSIGQLTGEGTVSPMHELDFKMSAVVKTGGLLAAAIQQRGETTTVPFFITGTSDNPVFKADVKSIANEKLQQALKNPEGAVKNAKDIANTAKGIINMFRKAPVQPDQK
jgi:AsmA protein